MLIKDLHIQRLHLHIWTWTADATTGLHNQRISSAALIFRRPIIHSLSNQTSWIFAWQSSLCSAHWSQKNESRRTQRSWTLTRWTCCLSACKLWITNAYIFTLIWLVAATPSVRWLLIAWNYIPDKGLVPKFWNIFLRIRHRAHVWHGLLFPLLSTWLGMLFESILYCLFAMFEVFMHVHRHALVYKCRNPLSLIATSP